MSSLDALRHALGALACAVAGHRFVVWVRPEAVAAARHPHLGAWARCARCGHERDWLWGGIGAGDEVLDRVHGVMRPLRDVIAIARGEIDPLRAPIDRALPVAPPPASRSSARAARRGAGEARGSRSGRKLPRDGRGSDRDPIA